MKFILSSNSVLFIDGEKKIEKPIKEINALFKALEISDKERNDALNDAEIKGNQVLHFGTNLKDFTKRFMFSCGLDN